MLDFDRVSVGLLRLAYNLNNDDITKILKSIDTSKCFYYDIWKETFEKYWIHDVELFNSSYGMKFKYNFPEFDSTIDITCITHRTSLIHFLQEIIQKIYAKHVNDGLLYVVTSIYSGLSFEKEEEFNILLEDISELEATFPTFYKEFNPSFDAMTTKEYHDLVNFKSLKFSIINYPCIDNIINDSILIDKSYIVTFLQRQGINLINEVKGLTYFIINNVIKFDDKSNNDIEIITDYKKREIHIDESLWFDFSYEVAAQNLIKEGLDNCIIAYIIRIKKKIGLEKTYDSLFLEECSGKNKQIKIKNLIKEFESKYIWVESIT